MCRYLLCSVLLLLGFNLVTKGQRVLIDSAEHDAAIQSAINLYTAAIGREGLLYSGTAYIEYPLKSSDTHPYFFSDVWETGSVWYDRERYENVPMLYNVSRDELIIQHVSEGGYPVKIKVFQSKIDSFLVHNHNFIKLESDSGNNLVKPGFYDLLYDGEAKLLAKRRKAMREEVSMTGAKLVFHDNSKYFFVIGGTFHTITGTKRSLLKLMGDKRKKAAQFARQRKLKFRENTEHDMTVLVRYYDNN